MKSNIILWNNADYYVLSKNRRIQYFDGFEDFQKHVKRNNLLLLERRWILWQRCRRYRCFCERAHWRRDIAYESLGRGGTKKKLFSFTTNRVTVFWSHFLKITRSIERDPILARPFLFYASPRTRMSVAVDIKKYITRIPGNSGGGRSRH